MIHSFTLAKNNLLLKVNRKPSLKEDKINKYENEKNSECNKTINNKVDNVKIIDNSKNNRNCKELIEEDIENEKYYVRTNTPANEFQENINNVKQEKINNIKHLLNNNLNSQKLKEEMCCTLKLQNKNLQEH